MEFSPERWMGDPRFANDNFKARQPFSVGPANCIGKNLAYAEMRLLLANLVWHFDGKFLTLSFTFVIIKFLQCHVMSSSLLCLAVDSEGFIVPGGNALISAIVEIVQEQEDGDWLERARIFTLWVKAELRVKLTEREL